MSEETTQNIPESRSFEERVFARFDAIDARFNVVDGRLIALEDRMMNLEEKVERKLLETRPIWEQVLARLDTLETEVRNGFRRLSREVGVMSKDVLEVRAAQQDLEARMDKLEGRNVPQR